MRTIIVEPKRLESTAGFIENANQEFDRTFQAIYNQVEKMSVSWSFYDLEQKLKYKASDNECLVINVNPKYTSQTCPCCGHIDKKSRRKKIHTFVCTKCGYTSNDDRIGAMNLYRMGIEYLVESQESTSFLSGAESTVPDVTSACV